MTQKAKRIKLPTYRKSGFSDILILFVVAFFFGGLGFGGATLYHYLFEKDKTPQIMIQQFMTEKKAYLKNHCVTVSETLSKNPNEGAIVREVIEFTCTVPNPDLPDEKVTWAFLHGINK